MNLARVCWKVAAWRPVPAAGAAAGAGIWRGYVAGRGFRGMWALSRDNLRRVDGTIAQILGVVLERLASMTARGRLRIQVIGEVGLLPAGTVGALREIGEAAPVRVHVVADRPGGSADEQATVSAPKKEGA